MAVAYRVADADEAVELADSTTYGLGGAVFSSDEALALDVADRLDVGMVWINQPEGGGPELPFGGTRLSGIGQNQPGISPAAEGRVSPLVGQELPVERHDNAVTGWVGLPADIKPEVDGAHDAVTELFVDEFFDRRAVNLKYLVEPVDRRIRRHGAVQGPASGLQLQSQADIVV